MIVVDSSAWISWRRDDGRPAVEKLDAIRETDNILVGDVVLLEVLQGARDEGDARRLASQLANFRQVSMLTPLLAIKAAENYRALRSRGRTVRKAIDLIIATYCIEHGHVLLHSDRDFDPFVEHLGLKVL